MHSPKSRSMKIRSAAYNGHFEFTCLYCPLLPHLQTGPVPRAGVVS
jgi:hypothetical protein